MNTLIALLAEQAKESIPKNKYEVNDWIAIYNETLAHMIVRECIETFRPKDGRVADVCGDWARFCIILCAKFGLDYEEVVNDYKQLD